MQTVLWFVHNLTNQNHPVQVNSKAAINTRSQHLCTSADNK